MGDPYTFCRTCSSQLHSSGSSASGRAISYNCSSEVFIRPDGTVRTVKACEYTPETRLDP